MAKMIRKLFTMTEEQERRLDILASDNASGFIQTVIDKLYEAKERQNAVEPIPRPAIRSIRL